MDLFMQSDSKRHKVSEEDEDQIFLLQVKIDKVNKQILDFPKIQQSIDTLSADFYQYRQHLIETEKNLKN